METIIVSCVFALCVAYEYLKGNFKAGSFSSADYKMMAICSIGISLVQRPIVAALIFLLAGWLIAPYQGILAPLEEQYFWFALLGFVSLEEYFHGLGHWFAHSRTPRFKWLRPVQKIFKVAHRPHHLIGNDDDKAHMTVGQTFVEGWTYWFVMPNIWFSFIALYLGLTEVFLYGMIFKGVWALHVHTNWQYDLHFLNHRKPVVRKIAFAMAHVFTFPTMHHHHHSRGKNSAKNLHNFLSLYDWLLYDTLSIETTAPKQYGWRQGDKEKDSAWYRFTRTYD